MTFDFSSLGRNRAWLDAGLREQGLDLVADSKGHMVPARILYFPPDKKVTGVRLISKSGGATLPVRVLPPWENGSAETTSSAANKPSGRKPFPLIPFELRHTGNFFGLDATALFVYPVQILPSGEVRLWQEMKLEVQFDAEPAAQKKMELRDKKAFLAEILDREGTGSQPRRADKASRPADASATDPANFAQVKIVVDADGIYQITFDDLREAGVDIPEKLDPWQLRLTNKGKTIPLYIKDGEDQKFDPGDYLEFYGEYNRSAQREDAPDVYLDIYSHDNVYWLEWREAQAQRMIEEEGLVLETDPRNFRTVYSFPSRVHVEWDRAYSRLSQYQEQKPRDHWFLDGGIFSSEKREYQLPLPDPDMQSDMPVELRVMLHGQTFDASTPHQVEAFLNRRLVLDGKWKGQTPFELRTTPETEISATVLNQHRNTITLVNRTATDVIDNFFVNWIEITYPRLLVPHDGYLEFTVPYNAGPGLFDFTVFGFNSDQISLYKLGVSKIVGADITAVESLEEETTYLLHFQDEVVTPNVRYFAVEDSAKKKPKLIEPHEAFDLRDPALAADYIIIVSDSLEESESLQSLVAHREQQGYRVLLVRASDVFNQFSYGLFSPYGIRDFLRYAYHHWPTRPQYVLLVGDGSFDNRNIHRLGTNQLPVISRQMAKYGAATSDHWYTLMDQQDQLPDLFLGRLPVNSEEQLAVMIAKILEYESVLQHGEWQNRILLIGGNGDIFRKQSEELTRNILPPRLNVRRVYARRDRSVEFDPFFGGTEEVVSSINEGLFLVNFMGHGGGAIWADNSLLQLEDVERLNNKGRYPIVTSMTCFTGAFDDPNRQTLSEELLSRADGGAVAVWASSGLGWTIDDFLIVRELFELMAEFGNSRTLGEYLAMAKFQYLLKYRNLPGFSIVHQYNLLGDPALRIQLPDSKIQISLDKEVSAPGDSIRISGRTEFTDGEVNLEIVTEDLRTFEEMSFPLQNGTFEYSLKIPQELISSTAHIRVYAKDAAATRHSSAAYKLPLQNIFVDTSFTSLSRAAGDSLRIFARILHRNDLASGEVILSLPFADTLNLRFNLEAELYETARLLRPLAPGEWVRYRIRARDAAGNEMVSDEYEEQKPHNPDLALFPNWIALVGDAAVGIQAYAFNLGDTDARNVIVRFERQRADGQTWELIGEDTTDVAAKAREEVRVNFIPGEGNLILRATIDPENKIAEKTESNNAVTRVMAVDIFPVLADLGTTLTAATNDTISYDERLRFYVAPQVVATNGAVRLQRLSKVEVKSQPDFVPISDQGAALAYRFSQADSLAILPQTTADIRFPVADLKIMQSDSSVVPVLNLPQAAICRLDESSGKWRKISDRRSGNDFYGSLPIPGTYGLFLVQDTQPPKVELTVEGQLFSMGGFVPREPVMGLSALDLNGIDRSPDGIKIRVDGNPWPFEQLAFVDSAMNLNAVAVQFRPKFAPGEHEIRLQVTDNAGNPSEPLVQHFKVSGDQELLFLGNYPNPFKTRTTFAYELTDHATDLELKIYTTAGKLVRRITADEIVEDPNPLGPNYHEVTWDVRDENGDRVANGMYYFKLVVKFPDKSVEHIGRVARLQ